MKKTLTAAEKAIPYAKYYDMPVDLLTEEEERLCAAPLPIEQVLPIEQAAQFVVGGDAFIGAPNGYYLYADGRSYRANCKVVPNVTRDMCLWWFQWMSYQPKGIGKECGHLRYKIWCPLDHWDYYPLNENDPSAGNVVVESFELGAGEPLRYMVGRDGDPAALGITQEMMEKAHAEGRWPGVGSGFDLEGNPTGVSISQFRDVPGGCEWSARSWSGYTFREGKLVKVENFKKQTVADARGEIVHNLVEESRLGKLLPLIYAEYKDKPIDEDF